MTFSEASANINTAQALHGNLHLFCVSPQPQMSTYIFYMTAEMSTPQCFFFAGVVSSCSSWTSDSPSSLRNSISFSVRVWRPPWQKRKRDGEVPIEPARGLQQLVESWRHSQQTRSELHCVLCVEEISHVVQD